ncbi:MAG TPA: sensor domain-containing diguanylate cyclase [Candidatus Dormibacteraeota bacterium]|nr:sensor domain-containing diguanylate cyclase [Candidatus Dormibacteraeota bacterium]
MDLAAVLLITLVLLVAAFLLLLLSLMRLRGTARELEAALADESGARDRAALLLTIASAVNSSLALEEVLNVALTHAGRIMGAVAGAMYLVRSGKAELYREASYNLTNRARGAMRKLDEEPLRTALPGMRPLVVKLDERTAPGLDAGGHPQDALVVPIQRSGQLMGAMELYLNEWRELNEDQADLLNGVASQAAIAISHAQLFQAQEETALTDELTKLPNRRALAQRFLQETQRARRHHSALSFLMIDLDHFKHVNDTFGHLNGDAVLAELASILSNGLRESDVCARYGGEEFALILPETTESGARVLAERIRAKVAAATFPGGLKLTISVGVAATEEPSIYTQLIDRADQALYAAKQGGRNQVRAADMRGPAPKPHQAKPEAEPV